MAGGASRRVKWRGSQKKKMRCTRSRDCNQASCHLQTLIGWHNLEKDTDGVKIELY